MDYRGVEGGASPIVDFFAETAVLRREIERLREDNEDLRASARLWIRLYDAALTRLAPPL